MEWQPIETAPKDCRLVLIREAHGNDFIGTFVGYFSPVDNAFLYSVGRAIKKPTHWMPLPPAPVKP